MEPERVIVERPDGHWDPMGTIQFAGSAAALGLIVLAVLLSEPGWVPLLDHTNLALHEAGHMFFAWFGSTAALYGGTLGQLVFPLAAMATFWWRRAPGGFAVCGAWLCENLFNVARYMADARAQQLPLVGGDQHDWLHIFSRWNVLASDTTIAQTTRVLGWLGIAACAAWLAWRFRCDRLERRTPQPPILPAPPSGA
jgi:hypothetical protein